MTFGISFKIVHSITLYFPALTQIYIETEFDVLQLTINQWYGQIYQIFTKYE